MAGRGRAAFTRDWTNVSDKFPSGSWTSYVDSTSNLWATTPGQPGLRRTDRVTMP